MNNGLGSTGLDYEVSQKKEAQEGGEDKNYYEMKGEEELRKLIRDLLYSSQSLQVLNKEIEKVLEEVLEEVLGKKILEVLESDRGFLLFHLLEELDGFKKVWMVNSLTRLEHKKRVKLLRKFNSNELLSIFKIIYDVKWLKAFSELYDEKKGFTLKDEFLDDNDKPNSKKIYKFYLKTLLDFFGEELLTRIQANIKEEELLTRIQANIREKVYKLVERIQSGKL